MTRTTRALAPLALACLVLAAPAAPAQDARTTIAEAERGGAININFPGGTMTEFVAALKAGVHGPLNVLLRGDAATLEVPPMDLKMVSIHTALQLAKPHDSVETNPDGSSTHYTSQLAKIGGDDRAAAPVFIISATQRSFTPAPEAAQRHEPASRIEVYSLEKLVENDADVKKLLAAIDTALALRESDRPTEIKYHHDTSLLIVRGSPEQVQTIERVIGRYHDTSSTRENERYEHAISLSEQKAELIERRAEMQRAEAEFEMGVEHVKAIKQLAEKKMSSQLDVLQAEMNLRMQEAGIQAARARYEAAQEKMALLAASMATRASTPNTYALPSTRLQISVSETLSAIAGISPHITAVESVMEGDGNTPAVKVNADEEGHAVVARVIGAISGRG